MVPNKRTQLDVAGDGRFFVGGWVDGEGFVVDAWTVDGFAAAGFIWMRGWVNGGGFVLDGWTSGRGSGYGFVVWTRSWWTG